MAQQSSRGVRCLDALGVRARASSACPIQSLDSRRRDHRWLLTLPPETWRRLGHGEPLDATHQNLSERTIAAVSELIDAGLKRVNLCQGRWTMGEPGSCDLPVGAEPKFGLWTQPVYRT